MRFPARLPARLPFVRDARSEGPHSIPSAVQIDSDTNWGGQLQPELKAALAARTSQGAAFLTHFSDEDMKRWDGACNGQCHIWMRLREANPSASAADRLNALGSFEGSVHAEIHQRAYSDNRQADFSIARLFGVDAWSAKPGTGDAMYTKDINDLNRMALHVNSHSGLSMDALPRALGEVSGYAVLRLDLQGSRAPRHTWAVHNAGQGHLVLFDPNYGEFHVEHARLPDFLKALNRQIEMELGSGVARIDIAPCIVDPAFEDTPAAALCRTLADGASPAPDAREEASQSSGTVAGHAVEAHPASGPGLRRRAGRSGSED